MLKGWKTYVIVAVGVIFNGLVGMGYLPEDALPVVNSILGFLGLGTLRASVKKVEEKQ